MKDRLYLLKPDFMDQGTGRFFCPDCALVEGMLSYYPALRDKIEIHYIEFSRPRPTLVGELGPENQGAPTLILGDTARPIPPDVTAGEAKGRRFISREIEICLYLARAYGYGEPHGAAKSPVKARGSLDSLLSTASGVRPKVTE